MTSTSEQALKVVIVGDGSVGKTSMLVAYTKHYYPQDFQTPEHLMKVNVEWVEAMSLTLVTYDKVPKYCSGNSVRIFCDSCKYHYRGFLIYLCPWHSLSRFLDYPVNLLCDGKNVTISLWDMQGQEEYTRVRALVYPNTDVVLVCYSIGILNSYENVFTKWIPEVKQNCPTAAIVFVATKTDLCHRTFTTQDDRETFRSHFPAAKHVECSAKNMDGLEKVFEEAVRAVHKVQPSSKRNCILL